MVEYEILYNDVKNTLSEKRFKHTEGVVERAIEYAKVYNVDIEDAKKAAVIHDIAKEFSKEENCEMIEKYGIELNEIEKANFNLVHGKIGAAIAKYKYGLSDEIANAVKYHTTGKENMTILEKIIYLADATEPGRKYEKNENDLTLEELVSLIKTNLDEGLEYVLKWTLNSILKRNLLIDLNSVNAYNFYNQKK